MNAVAWRALVRERNGSLTDVAERRPVADAEVLDDLRAGRPFRAHHRDSGADCTIEVLARVMGTLSIGEGLCGACGGRSTLADLLTLVSPARRIPPSRP